MLWDPQQLLGWGDFPISSMVVPTACKGILVKRMGKGSRVTLIRRKLYCWVWDFKVLSKLLGMYILLT